MKLRLIALTFALMIGSGCTDKYGTALEAAAQHYGKGDYVGAMEQYKLALTLKPNDPAALCGLGNALYGSGNNAEAIRAYSESVRDAIPWAGAHRCRWWLAWLLLQAKRFDEARVQFQTVVKEDPSDCGARANLAFIAVAEGRLAEARSLRETPTPCPAELFRFPVGPQS